MRTLRFLTAVPAAFFLCAAVFRPVSAAGREYLDWIKAAKQGDTEKAYLAGTAFYRGSGGAKRDYKKAFEWFSKAALGDHLSACVRLGDMYAYGQYVDRNPAEALKWHLKAAFAGDPEGMEKAGDDYLERQDSEGYYAEAAAWYRRAADATGARGVSFKLARLYYSGGPGVERADDRALPLFLKVFEAGEPDAARYLSGIYEARGDLKTAGEWLRKGAEEGGPTVMFYLAKAYLDLEEYAGKGLVAPSAAQAYKWLCVLLKIEPQPRYAKLRKKASAKLSKAARIKAEKEAETLLAGFDPKSGKGPRFRARGKPIKK